MSLCETFHLLQLRLTVIYAVSMSLACQLKSLFKIHFTTEWEFFSVYSNMSTHRFPSRGPNHMAAARLLRSSLSFPDVRKLLIFCSCKVRNTISTSIRDHTNLLSQHAYSSIGNFSTDGAPYGQEDANHVEIEVQPEHFFSQCYPKTYHQPRSVTHLQFNSQVVAGNVDCWALISLLHGFHPMAPHFILPYISQCQIGIR